jgi:excisionase family DNA binding protein
MSETAQLEQFTSARRVAAALDCTKPAVFDLIRKGELHAVRVGRKWAISVDSYRDYIERHRHKPDASLVRAKAKDNEAEEASAEKDGDEDEDEAA